MGETVDSGRVIREERRPITALFADVVGSTTLAERLDDAELKLVMDGWWEYGKSWASFADLTIGART